jgi:1,2-diacylglycerol 3-alpha-glucosyltransferase
MKILFVSDTYYPHINGVYYFVCRVGPLLEKKGHQVAVIAPSESTRVTEKLIDGITVYGMSSLPILYYPKLRFPVSVFLKSRLRRILLEFKPDIIHLQDHFILSKAVTELNKKTKIPIIGTNHFMAENLTALFGSKKVKRILEEMIWKRFTRVYNQLQLVTTPTETAAGLIRPKLKTKVIAISSGINLKEFNPHGERVNIREKYNLGDKPLLLFVGRLDPEKNIEEILYAVARAIKKIDFYFVIVGKGMRRKVLEHIALQEGIGENVIFTGFVPDEDLPYFYKVSRCFIIASTAELLSLAALQAMASGMPVIAVKAGALCELVQDKVNGYLYNEGDIDTIVQCICDIFTDSELYKKMSAKSLERSIRHDINKTVVLFENVYKNNSRKQNSLIQINASQDLIKN